jgi:hypothetical protein
VTDTLEPLAIKAPTAFDDAIDRWSRATRQSDDEMLALGDMVRALHAELADEREIVRGQAAQIGSLKRQIGSLQNSVLGWIDDTVGTIEVGTQQPTMRMRLNHTHTKADGWRLSETTVEWSGVGDPDEAAIDKALITAFHLGQREANLRNAPEPADDEDGV